MNGDDAGPMPCRNLEIAIEIATRQADTVGAIRGPALEKAVEILEHVRREGIGQHRAMAERARAPLEASVIPPDEPSRATSAWSTTSSKPLLVQQVERQLAVLERRLDLGIRIARSQIGRSGRTTCTTRTSCTSCTAAPRTARSSAAPIAAPLRPGCGGTYVRSNTPDEAARVVKVGVEEQAAGKTERRGSRSALSPRSCSVYQVVAETPLCRRRFLVARTRERFDQMLIAASGGIRASASARV